MAPDSIVPELPGGDRITRRTNSGLYTPEHLGATKNEQTFPSDLADQLAQLEADIERHDHNSHLEAPEFSQPVKVTAVPAASPRPEPKMIRPKPVPAPARVRKDDEEEKTFNVIRRAWRKFIKSKFDKAEADTQAKHTPWPVVVITGLFAAASTAGAFVLSFTMLVLVMAAMGFAEQVTWLGPVAIDVAALTAATFLVTKDPHYRRLGWFLLVFSTGASIYGNLVGHAIQEVRQAVPFHLPNNMVYGNAGIFFSIFFPSVMAVLVHCFMAQLTGNLEYRKRVRAEAAEQARREAEAQAEAERAEADRKARAEAAEAKRSELLASLPKPKRRGEEVSKDVAVQYGIAYGRTTPARLADVLQEAGWKERSESTMKDYCREIKVALGVN